MHFLTFVMKNLFRRKMRSILTIIGASVAIGAVVALVGISDGFEKSYANLFESRGVDLVVSKKGVSAQQIASLDERFGEKIGQLQGVRDVSPALLDFAAIGSAVAVPIQGWTPNSFSFQHLKLIDGQLPDPAGHGTALLGKSLARDLGKKVGDKIEIEGRDFEVVGVFEALSVYEDGSAIVFLKDLQEGMRTPNLVTGFQIILDDAPDKEAEAQKVIQEVEALTDDQGRPLNLTAKSIKDHVGDTLQIRLAHAMAWLTSIIALIIGTVGILNTMIMSVFERTREIGILRAIGWRKSRVVRMILYESVFLSIIGALVGTLGAFAITAILTRLPMASGYVSQAISPRVIAEGFVIAILVGLFGGIYPAVRATWLLPTEALRHE